MSIQIPHHSRQILCTTALLATLTACGGGSDAPDLPCGGGNPLSISITYDVNGVLVDPNRVVILQRDVPTTATPRILGLPDACKAAARLTATQRALSLPSGMRFDATTGVFSGTPVSRGTFTIELKVAIDGYTNSVQQTIDFFM